jgi:hypothetical protein
MYSKGIQSVLGTHPLLAGRSPSRAKRTPSCFLLLFRRLHCNVRPPGQSKDSIDILSIQNCSGLRLLAGRRFGCEDFRSFLASIEC